MSPEKKDTRRQTLHDSSERGLQTPNNEFGGGACLMRQVVSGFLMARPIGWSISKSCRLVSDARADAVPLPRLLWHLLLTASCAG